MKETRAKTADELPDPTPTDARRAVIDAARFDGMTCQRGAFTATRTWMEGDDMAFGTYKKQHVIKLQRRIGYGGDTIGLYPLPPVSDIRDDWSHPTPDWHERGDMVLPPDEFDLDEIFHEPAILPGIPEEQPTGDHQ